MANDHSEVELITGGVSDEGQEGRHSGRRPPETSWLRHVGSRWLPMLSLVILFGAVGVLSVLMVPSGPADIDGDDLLLPEPDQPDQPERRAVAQSVPRPLLVAELYSTDPTAAGLRDLFEVVGGFDGLTVGAAEGSFDLVRFDPVDSNRLLATHRSSYGSAENQQVNELWRLGADQVVEQTLWAPSQSHDFAHFNVDGTVTMWVHGGGDGYAPRTAVVLENDLTPISVTEPVYGSRFSSAGGTVFALTGTGDYYTNEDRYVDLVADDGLGPVILADGAGFGWIDNPLPEILVAYPIDDGGSTAVWDAVTLEPLPGHPLAGRNLLRVAVGAERTVAVGVTLDGELEAIDLATGATTARFGSVDIGGVDQPVSLNYDGSIAITVESTGDVTLWWVGDDRPIASTKADAAQPRWVSARYGAISASVVALDAGRVALRGAARPGSPTSWRMVDTDPDSWVRRACAQSGRPLTPAEAKALGLSDQPRACPAQ